MQISAGWCAPRHDCIIHTGPSPRRRLDAPFKLSLDAVEIEGSTDGKGWIRGKIPGWATEGTLKLWLNPEDPDAVIQWPVKLGHLDPLETTSGVKGRLNNLGYYCGEVNEVEDERYDASVRQFQEDHGLVVDGIVGPKTRAKLKSEHRV